MWDDIVHAYIILALHNVGRIYSIAVANAELTADFRRLERVCEVFDEFRADPDDVLPESEEVATAGEGPNLCVFASLSHVGSRYVLLRTESSVQRTVHGRVLNFTQCNNEMTD